MRRHQLRLSTVFLISLLALSGGARAQDYTASAPPAPVYSQAQLDQMLAPIALYPDPLIGQVLMASTYPLEIVEASRWLKNPANASLQGEQLADALQQQPWDPSVKSLVAFPQVVHMMDANIQWTEQLGDAFIAQQGPVMDSVQHLRQQAQTIGALTSNPQQVVSTQGQEIIIEPENPETVYVPVYNPTVVYGAWAYPAYPPYYFYPGYNYGGAIIGFGAGIFVADSLWGWDRWDWHHHRIDIDDHRFSELNRGQAPMTNGVWQHNPDHRHGVPYRDAATRARFQGGASPETQRGFRGYGRPVAAQTAHASLPVTRVSASAGRSAFRPATQPQINRATAQQEMRPAPLAAPASARQTIEARPAPSHVFAPPSSLQRQMISEPRPATPMLESYARGSDVRMQSARGSMSRTAPAPAPVRAAPAGNRDERSGGEHR